MVPRSIVVSVVLLGGIALSGGCAGPNGVVLQYPRNDEVLQVGDAPGPVFRWATRLPSREKIEFNLVIARDPSFSQGSVVHLAGQLPAPGYSILPEKGWLDGGTRYYWRVDGSSRGNKGRTVSIPCEQPGSFSIEPRERVEIDFKLPIAKESGSRCVFTVGSEEFTSDATFGMEIGQQKKVVIRIWHEGKQLAAGGRIWVIGVNENTKYGRIVIDNLTEEELTRISQGDVGDFTYTLGGDEIVKMKLGSRIE